MDCQIARIVSWVNPILAVLAILAFQASLGSIQKRQLTLRNPPKGVSMSTYGFIEYEDASPEVKAVYDDIKATRKIDKVTNFWKALAHDPARLKRTWEDTKQIMAAGSLDALVKELIY